MEPADGIGIATGGLKVDDADGCPANTPNMEDEWEREVREFYFRRGPFENADGMEIAPILNEGQQNAFGKICAALWAKPSGGGNRLFFLYGSGGSGKTFLYNYLIDFCQRNAKCVLPTATTGIAATLLYNGHTVHSAFMFPARKLDPQNPSKYVPGGLPALKLIRADLIIIDEITMLNRDVMVVIDKVLQNLMKNDMLFGGKVIIISGDWKQLLPVVPGNVAAQVKQCVRFYENYEKFIPLGLAENMRAVNDVAFSEWLEKIGCGKNLSSSQIETIPPQFIVKDLDHLLDFILDGGRALSLPETLAHRLVLTPLRREAEYINEIINDQIVGTGRVYFSTDRLLDRDGKRVEIDQRRLNQLCPSGCPNYALTLKVGSVVMLLRNLAIHEGLCNGTRLIVTALGENVTCRIMTGPMRFCGLEKELGPIRFNAPGIGHGSRFQRIQLPLQLAYSVTIHKAQGQTADAVGLYLNNPVFACGQLYTAFSRVRHAQALRIVTSNFRPCQPCPVKNIVAGFLRDE